MLPSTLQKKMTATDRQSKPKQSERALDIQDSVVYVFVRPVRRHTVDKTDCSRAYGAYLLQKYIILPFLLTLRNFCSIKIVDCE